MDLLLKKYRILFASILILTIGYWCLLIFNIPILQSLWYWFWELNYKPLKEIWLLPLLIVASIIVLYFIKKNNKRTIANIILLILLGFSIQLGFGFIEGRGIYGLKDRLMLTGHSEFARLATSENDIGFIASNYESLLDSNRLGKFPKSKPPGTLLTYMFFQKISNIINPVQSIDDKFERFTTFASFWFPLLCYFALVPLYLISKKFLCESAIFPCLLYIFIPNVTLSTLNLDQALYPTIILICMLFIINTFSKKSIKYAILSGIFIYISIYISFSLVPMLVFYFLIAMSYFILEKNKKVEYKQYLKIIAIVFLSFIIMQLIFYFSFNYNIIERYTNAIQFHSDWKVWVPTFKKTLYFAFLNSIEFACWVGIPITILYFTNIFYSASSIYNKSFNLIDLLSLSLIFVIITTALLGKTKAETARLWIFFVPIICFLATIEIIKISKKKWLTLYLIIFLQFITIIIIKVYQDYH